MQTKTLPIKIEAEQGVLGSIIIDPDALVEIVPTLRAQDFYRDAHRSIYEAIIHLYEKQIPADFVTICDELERRNLLDEVGGDIYLMDLTRCVPTSGNAKYYADIVARAAEHRAIIEIAGQIAQMAFEEKPETLQFAEQKILEVGKHRPNQDFYRIGDYYQPYASRLEKMQRDGTQTRGVSTHLRSLDQILGKLQNGKLYIPAARPGVGKTSICQDIAYRVAVKDKKHVAFFSMEMSEDELMDRFMSMQTKINSMKLQNADLQEPDWKRIVEAGDVMEDLHIYFRYTPGMYVDELASTARRLAQKHGIDLLVVDYTQLLKARIDGKRITVREMEVAEIVRTLKELAGELQIPILAPAQINRQVERSAMLKDEKTNYSYRMPMLADLRESGELEQSADVVIFLARAEEKEDMVKLVVAKHRGGPTGDADLYFKGETTQFFSVISQYDEYGQRIEEI